MKALLIARLREGASPFSRWFGLTLLWAVFLALFGLTLAFRCVKTSASADLIHFEDIPVLRAVAESYARLYLSCALCGAGVLAGLAMGWSGLRATRSGRALPVAVLAAVVLVLWVNRYHTSETLDLMHWGIVDWLAVATAATAALLFLPALDYLAKDLHCGPRRADEHGIAWPVRFSIVFLLSGAAVFLYALGDHLRFWNPHVNGGYRYARFFAEGEVAQAKVVLYSTSALFASVAALAACAALGAYRCVARAHAGGELHLEDCRHQAFVAGTAWSVVLVAPWQVKLYPEIRAEGAWIFPAGLLVLTCAALIPLVFLSLIVLKRDFDEMRRMRGGNLYVYRGEYLFMAFFLCVPYPLLRLFRVRRPRLHLVAPMALAIAVLGGLTWGLHHARHSYDFDDWRGMVKAGFFPAARVFLSLCTAAAVYLILRRLLTGWDGSLPAWAQPRRWARRAGGVAMVSGAAACLLLASWPLLGWPGIHRNTVARVQEFSSRHEFELGFLHWLLDANGDGVADVLLEPRVRSWLARHPHPEHIPSAGPLMRWEVADAERARAFPNVVLLFLEGVTPQSIGAFGQRNLGPGITPTPHLDAIAAEGALFTRARCCYPSTWDGWYAVLSGCFLRVQEMKQSDLQGDRYSAHNGIHALLARAGFNRWCYPATAPFTKLFMPPDDRGKNWEPHFDSLPSNSDEVREITRGDKCNQRMLRFLDSIQPGERFFMSEHLTDTHFPWERVSRKRAAELGCPDGFSFVEKDACVDGLFIPRLACYYQTVARVDAQVGQLVDKLKEKGLYEQTMIVVVSDHGCQWYEHEHMYYVSHLYEQSLHIPLIVKMPGFPKGVVSKAPVLQMDLLPTFLELAGIAGTPIAGQPRSIGQSLVPLMRGEPGAEGLERYRKRDLLLTTHFDTLGYLDEFGWKLIFHRPSGTYLLFNLQNDPEEMFNQADAQPDKVEELMTRLRAAAQRETGFFKGFDAGLAPPARP